MKRGSHRQKKTRKKNGENSTPLLSLPVDRLNGGRLQHRHMCQLTKSKHCNVSLKSITLDSEVFKINLLKAHQNGQSPLISQQYQFIKVTLVGSLNLCLKMPEKMQKIKIHYNDGFNLLYEGRGYIFPTLLISFPKPNPQ